VLDVVVGYDKLDDEATRAASTYIPHRGYRQFLRLPAVAYSKRYSKNLEYEYRVKTAALGTLK
jgi:hypothetical protein